MNFPPSLGRRVLASRREIFSFLGAEIKGEAKWQGQARRALAFRKEGRIPFLGAEMMNASAQIERARQADLLTVARSLGLHLKREGKYWRIPGHGGLMIYRKNGVWVWCQMSEERGGDAISFLTSSPVSSMSFKEAVEMLTGEQWVSGGATGFKGKKALFLP